MYSCIFQTDSQAGDHRILLVSYLISFEPFLNACSQDRRKVAASRRTVAATGDGLTPPKISPGTYRTGPAQGARFYVVVGLTTCFVFLLSSCKPGTSCPQPIRGSTVSKVLTVHLLRKSYLLAGAMQLLF